MKKSLPKSLRKLQKLLVEGTNRICLTGRSSFAFRLGDVLLLWPERKDIEVHVGIDRLHNIQKGSTILWAIEKPEDLDWLKQNPFFFAKRNIQLILWLQNKNLLYDLEKSGIEFLKNSSQFISLPGGLPSHGFANIRAGIRFAKLAWTGGDFHHFWKKLFPKRKCSSITIQTTYQKLLAQIRNAKHDCIVWKNIENASDIKLLERALLEANFQGVSILQKSLYIPGNWWAAHGKIKNLYDTVREFQTIGVPKPGRLAALSGLEPELISLIKELFSLGVTQEEIEIKLEELPDPGISLANHPKALSYIKSTLSLGKHGSPLTLRACPDYFLPPAPFQSPVSRVELSYILYQNAHKNFENGQYNLAFSLLSEALSYQSNLFENITDKKNAQILKKHFQAAEKARKSGNASEIIEKYQKVFLALPNLPDNQEKISYLPPFNARKNDTLTQESVSSVFQDTIDEKEKKDKTTLIDLYLQLEKGRQLLKANDPFGNKIFQNAMHLIGGIQGNSHPSFKRLLQEVKENKVQGQRKLLGFVLRLQMCSILFATLSRFTPIFAKEINSYLQTDGKSIFIHPDLLLALSTHQLDGTILSIILQNALKHFLASDITEDMLKQTIEEFIKDTTFLECSRHFKPQEHCVWHKTIKEEELKNYWQKALSESIRLKPEYLGNIKDNPKNLFLLLKPSFFENSLAAKSIVHDIKREEFTGIEAICMGKGENIVFPEDPLFRYALIAHLISFLKHPEEFRNVFFWISQKTSPEWIQFFVSQSMIKMRAIGRVGDLAVLTQKEPVLRQFIKDFQKILDLDEEN